MEVLPELPTGRNGRAASSAELLREAGAAFVIAAQPAVESEAKSRLPSAEAVRVFGAGVGRAKARRLYRVDSSSKPGAFYEFRR